jgi:hypothetical protein
MTDARTVRVAVNGYGVIHVQREAASGEWRSLAVTRAAIQHAAST